MTKEELIKELEEKPSVMKCFAEALEMVIEETLKQQKKGKWIEMEDDERISGICSCCGWEALLYEIDVVGMPFCPNCGAKMDGNEKAVQEEM